MATAARSHRTAQPAKTSAVFVKHYTDTGRGVAARQHLLWLQSIASGVRLPHLYPGTATHLVMERLPGRHPGPGDLTEVAAALGRLHARAYHTHLHSARLDQPFAGSDGITIADFHSSRRHVLTRLDIQHSTAPAALYKDANLRNFLITPDDVGVVDFDDLTLAPFGYDLAKLVVSTAMTHGRLGNASIETALGAYNRSVAANGGPNDGCTTADLLRYCEVHHLLTAAYLHRNGYQHTWPTVRPGPAPLPARH
ncbi:phosphotransferase [Micromonospora sp. NPDC085948]|uniref:phosphotransferase n=1 Tax=Micromonospora sp. NPDC085948 TaxID=3155293 RepID=UPI003444414D